MKKATKFVAVSAASLLVLAGCAAEETVTDETTSAAPAPAVEELPAGDGSVTIYGGYGEAQAAAFQQALDEFGAANGIEITFESLAAYDTDIQVAIESGQEPDIGMWPQPGGLKNLAEYLVSLDTVFDTSVPLGTLVPGWGSLAEVDGQLFGLPVSANQKSLVFYNPEAFAAAGYDVPGSESELQALEAQIIADGSGYPWCAGIESGGATGWAFTDWMEQYVLGLHGSDVYAKWVTGEVDFASDEISAAAELVSARLLAEGHVNGGGVSMATDNFGNTAPLFETGGKSAGQCFMLRQGSFITSFMPEDIQAEIAAGDYSRISVFPVPAPEGGQAAVIGGGDIFAVFDGHVDQDVAAVAAFIASPEVLKYQVATGDLSPHATFDLSLYPNDLIRSFGAGLANAAVFGFDASDQMPAEVNGEFWASGTNFVTGSLTWQQAAELIDGKY
ncbi:MAG: carbohydrate ABC transporter substrate-binding protein [Micrococcales bacterium]|jgi:alpha-glucoside transport system substrate-binding protein|nr:carbohydrate ABC transporter substrate-binding protein [Micrococcales bacterium]MBT5398782.1 carbohydrate ABC transporter substrate-binding protein [Micrococcales bacterium]MBT5431414.1 carbohydrate ABC transporter substrate-binding protein [Micrococcales bacterium]MBT7926498.1 carbohydrate ABC transporter substrate-binding protein [Micrococcales bacterium]